MPPDSVTVMAGDTSVIPYGQGGFASRQTVTAGSAVHLAAAAVRDKALKVAAHLLEAGPDDLELRDGRIEIAGAPGSGLSLREVAEAVSGVPGYAMPGQFEPGLESMQSFLPNALTYGGGSHAVEVEVDIETCGVRILRYVIVNDSGRIINPMIVEGQIVGGAAHGIGNALLGMDGLRRRRPAGHHHLRRLSPCRARPSCRGSRCNSPTSPPRSIRSASRVSANPAACPPPARSCRRSSMRWRRSACGLRNIR